MSMTENEALEIIKRKSSIPMGNETFDEIEEAYDIAIKALEKQIPKMINIQKTEDGSEYAECPICEKFIYWMEDSYDEDYRDNYCAKCGSKLDWGMKGEEYDD